MVNADSGQAVHSSERSDGGSGSCEPPQLVSSSSYGLSSVRSHRGCLWRVWTRSRRPRPGGKLSTASTVITPRVSRRGSLRECASYATPSASAQPRARAQVWSSMGLPEFRAASRNTSLADADIVIQATERSVADLPLRDHRSRSPPTYARPGGRDYLDACLHGSTAAPRAMGACARGAPMPRALEPSRGGHRYA
jgi:hypothetical protein